MTTEALRKAQAKYEAKRKAHRLPSVYLTDEENKLFELALKKNGGSKKATILEALRVYVET